jgi:hypothetical protein
MGPSGGGQAQIAAVQPHCDNAPKTVHQKLRHLWDVYGKRQTQGFGQITCLQEMFPAEGHVEENVKDGPAGERAAPRTHPSRLSFSPRGAAGEGMLVFRKSGIPGVSKPRLPESTRPTVVTLGLARIIHKFAHGCRIGRGNRRLRLFCAKSRAKSGEEGNAKERRAQRIYLCTANGRNPHSLRQFGIILPTNDFAEPSSSKMIEGKIMV